MNDWEEYAGYFSFCYNISHKYSTYELVFGKKPVLPFEWLDGQIYADYNVDDFEAGMFIDKLKLRNNSYYDRSAELLDLKIKDKVKLVRNKRHSAF